MTDDPPGWAFKSAAVGEGWIVSSTVGEHSAERTLMAEEEAKASLQGVVEDVKGKAKEVAGRVTGDERLETEGSAQQDKAASEREVAEHEAKADAARAKEKANEARQRAAQD